MRRTIFLLVSIAAASGFAPPAPSPAQKASPTYEQYTPPQSQQEIERKAMSQLSNGHQSAAEELLANHIKTLPDIAQLVALIQQGKPTEAEAVMEKHAAVYRANQRLIYLFAACTRSRFDVKEAMRLFVVAGMANEKTLLGQSTFRIVMLDGVKEIQQKPERSFADLEKMVASHPDEIAVRWMLAVQCRSYNRNVQGVIHYKKLLEKWKPGPVLAHQTYANLLDELNRFDEALVERRMAVKLEPAGWSYDGLGNTLDSLGRFDEADKAHAKASALDPADGHSLGNWAANAMLRKKYDDAIKRCALATQLDPAYPRTWSVWGQCLEAQGKNTESLKKFRKVLELCPNDPDAARHVERLQKAFGKEPVADPFR